ncbi:MAG: nitrite reductase (NAD(P)H) small subunit [Betaproteobacteria bacterium]
MSDGYLEGYEIECPLHGARFDIRDGRVLCQPAAQDVASYPVRIEDDEVSVELP